MAATIKIKNSSTASAVPTSSDLVQGELAVNVTDKRIFTENASGTVVELGTNPSILTLPDGSASAPTLTNDGDTNTGIFFPAADTVGITTGGSERLRVDASGNIGLGVTPSAWRSTWKALQIGTRASYISGTVGQPIISYNAYQNTSSQWIYLASGTGASNYEQSDGIHYWYNAPSGTAGNAISFTQAMTLDASGNLGVGTTSPKERLDISGLNGNIRVYGRSGVAANQISSNVYYNGSSWVHDVAKGSSAIILDTDTDNAIKLCVDASTSGFPTERARIDSSGNLLVGATATDSGAKTRIVYGASSNGLQLKDSADTSNTAFVIFQNGSNSNIGTISRVGTTNVVAYNTTSDERLKNDLGVAVSDTVIDALVIHDFSWKTDGTLDRGVFAQEAAIVKPLAVREGSDELDENGNPKNPWGVDYSKFVPDLIVYCQQLKKQVQQLQAAVAALKGQA